MKLTVVIVSYNVKYYLEQCLLSLRRALEGIEAEVIVVDNHSRDGSVEYIGSRFPNARVIALQHNTGFASANNVAIRNSNGEYILLLNPDTIVAENTIREALQFMDTHPKVGAAGVRMLKADGTSAMESRRGIPTPMTAFYKMSGLCRRFPQSRRFAKYYMSWLPWDSPQRIEVVSGAFFLIRRSVLDDVGLLDTDFFMYGEDIDLSYRISKTHWECWYLPLKIVHYKGESTESSSFRYVHVFYEAMLIFFRKHYGSLSFWLSIPIKAAIYVKAFTALVSTSMERTRKNLGFFSKRHSRQEPLYIFIGDDDNRRIFMRLARQRGLQTAEYGDDECNANDSRLRVFVFDTDSHSYLEIFNQMIARQRPSARLGTFYPAPGIIITDREVIL